MAKKKIDKDEYMIRSLAYYHEQGGIYNELITILTNLRKKQRGLPTIAKILNEACYWCALLQQRLQEAQWADKEQVALGSTDYGMCTMTQWEEEIDNIKSIPQPVDRYVVASLVVGTVDGGDYVLDEICKAGEKDKVFFPAFKSLLKKPEPKAEVQISEAETYYIKQIEDLKDELLAKDSLLADANNKVDELERMVKDLSAKGSSKLDKAFTFDSLMEYAKNLKQYQFANQLLEMLKDKCAMVGAQDEYQKVLELKQQLIDASVPTIHNHNDIHNSNVFPGMVSNPSFSMDKAMMKEIITEMLNQKENGKQ